MRDFLQAIVYGGIFAVPFIVLIVVNDLFFPFITGKNFAFRIVVEILFAAWILLAFLDVRFRPRWSWILGGFGTLLVVMFFANLFGQHPHTSFWSNYERMDGYVTLVHLFMYFVVAGSMLRSQKVWTWFWHTSLVAATIVAIDGLQQYLDPETPSRIAGMLGNSTYLAVYMLFHVFLLLYLLFRTDLSVKKMVIAVGAVLVVPLSYMVSALVPLRKDIFRLLQEWSLWKAVLYLVLLVFFTFILLQTGTRGTALGLAAGLVTMVLYVAIFSVHNKEARSYAIGACALLLLSVGGFMAVKDQPIVQDNTNLSRIANINLQDDLEVRRTIWGLAWEGVEERPVLGWGQSNFNFVFNQYYDPFLYDQEQWFDRVHNIFLDWLVAGGVLGFLAYFGTMAAAVFYLVRRQSRLPEEQRFTVLEQSVFLGLLVAYLAHNSVVFDNIISYIFYATVLAMIHARVATPIKSIESLSITPNTVRDVAAPAVAVILLSTIYFVNIPSIRAAGDIITAMRAPSLEARQASFEQALDRGSFAKQEIAEQYVQQALSVAAMQEIPQDDREMFVSRAERALVQAARDKPGDARIHVFLGSFYRSVGVPVQAREQLQLARDLSPRKQSIIIQQGATELALGDTEAALEYFKTAYELDTRNQEALTLYAATLLQTDNVADALVLLYGEELPDVSSDAATDTDDAVASVRIDPSNPPATLRAFANNDFALNAANSAETYQLLADLYEIRAAANPGRIQEWASLSFVYYEMGQIDAAIDTLDRAASATPAFAESAECIADNIRSGRAPQEGC